jgi:hypothetical protein
LQGLRGLRAKELRKINIVNGRRNNNPIQILKQFPNALPMDCLISEYLRPSDHLVCDIDSVDLWIKLNL